MPLTQQERSDIFGSIEKIKETVAARNEVTVRLETVVLPLVEFVGRVKEGDCPTGKNHTREITALAARAETIERTIDPVVTAHNKRTTFWQSVLAGVLITVLGALLVSFVLRSGATANAQTSAKERSEMTDKLDNIERMLNMRYVPGVSRPMRGAKPIPPREGYNSMEAKP